MTHEPSDAYLLDRFVNRREEAAFAALVRRHGARVRSACRRILVGEHDAEEVVQSTFLLLALKADRLDPRDSVGGWLCGVARRLALQARAGVLRRSRREVPVAVLVGAGDGRCDLLPEECHPWADPFAEIVRRDLKRVLDDELGRLPEKYRDPLVLCDVEGLTHEEAAVRLGYPAGSMSRRLGRTRAALRQRLSGRGVPAAVVLIVGMLAAFAGGTRRPAAFDPARRPVREAMAPFGPTADGHERIERLLRRVASGDQASPSRIDLRRTADAAEQAALRLAALDPGRDRDAWRRDADGLRTSALTLARAVERGDAPSLLVAARGVQESCVRCHLTFRD